MDFGLSEGLVILREMVRGFAAGTIAPFADQWEANHTCGMRKEKEHGEKSG